MSPTAWHFARGYLVYAALFIAVIFGAMLALEGKLGEALFQLWPITTLLLVKPLSNIQHPALGLLTSAAMLAGIILGHVWLIQNAHGYATFGFSALYTPLAAGILLVTAILCRALARKVATGFVIGYGFHNDQPD